MTDRAVFEIEIKENGEVAFNKLADGAQRFSTHAQKAKESGIELSNSFAKLKETMLEAAGVYEVFSFGQQSEQLYLGVKRADAEIQASLKSTQDAAGVTNEQLKQGSDELYHHSEYSLDNIKRMQAVLLTFPKIAKDQFGEASQAITDVAAKLYGPSADLKQVTIQIGKALQDPATGMTMLRREGVNFSKQQTDMVNAMVKAGHQAQAERYILKELETEFGGSADAAYEAGGAHEHMAKTVEDLKLQVGQFVDEIETDLVPVFTVIVGDIQSAVKWGESHKELLENTAKVVVVLVAAYAAYQAAVKASAIADALFGSSMADLAIGMEAETAAAGEATEAMTALDVAMDANPIGLVTAAVVGLAAALGMAGESADSLHYKLNHLHDTGSKGMKAIVSDFRSKDADEQAEDYKKVGDQIASVQKSIAYAQEQSKRWGDKSGAYAKEEDEDYKDLQKLYKVQSQMFDIMHPKSTSLKGAASGSASLATPSLPSANGKDSGKQIVNTWNIKEFGKMYITPREMNEGASTVHDKMMEALTSAINDSEIASGQ